MCAVSYVGDYFGTSIPQKYPWVSPGGVWPLNPPTANPYPNPLDLSKTFPTRDEFEALKREVEELKILLKAAKRFDEQTGQPDCHMDAKVALIKQLAEYVGVDLEGIFGDN